MIANKTGKCGGAREAESEAHLIGSRLDFRGCEERFQFCNAEVAYADTPVTQRMHVREKSFQTMERQTTKENVDGNGGEIGVARR